jgi:hypothetical protein
VLADDQTYCLECGTPTPRAPRLSRQRKGALIAGALVVLGIGAGALAYAVANEDRAAGVATTTVPVTDTVAIVTSDQFTIPTDTVTGNLPPDTSGFPVVPTTDDFPVITEQPDPDAPAVPDPNDPIDPVDPIDPLDPIDPIDPVDPIDPGAGASDWPAGVTGWTAIVSSTRSESEARQTADALAATGEEAGVLFSSDHPGLRPGYWAVFSGTFTSRSEAASHAQVLAGRYPGAYPREIRS